MFNKNGKSNDKIDAEKIARQLDQIARVEKVKKMIFGEPKKKVLKKRHVPTPIHEKAVLAVAAVVSGLVFMAIADR